MLELDLEPGFYPDRAAAYPCGDFWIWHCMSKERIKHAKEETRRRANCRKKSRDGEVTRREAVATNPRSDEN